MFERDQRQVEFVRNATRNTLTEKGVADPYRWADTLLASVLDIPNRNLDSCGNRALTDEESGRVQELIGRISPDAPVAYLVGRAPFLDKDFEVTPDTLICKADTELFVRIVLEQVATRDFPREPLILELCTGSGCVAITMADNFPGARVVATDISSAALTVAHRNVIRHGLEGRVLLGEGDLFAPVAKLADGRKFDLIVSNPPYIPTEKIPAMGKHVAEHEPHLALDGGDDGLDPHRRILAEAISYLVPKGHLFLEHEWYQGEAARQIAGNFAEYTDIQTFVDANGKDRALYARFRA